MLSLMTFLGKYWYLSIILFLVIMLYGERQALSSCSFKLKAIEAQISALKKASNEAQGRAEAANKEAATELKEHEKEAEKIMGESVPKDCMGAMQWGIDQADHF